jgi:hypothetical protein
LVNLLVANFQKIQEQETDKLLHMYLNLLLLLGVVDAQSIVPMPEQASFYWIETTRKRKRLRK